MGIWAVVVGVGVEESGMGKGVEPLEIRAAFVFGVSFNLATWLCIIRCPFVRLPVSMCVSACMDG